MQKRDLLSIIKSNKDNINVASSSLDRENFIFRRIMTRKDEEDDWKFAENRGIVGVVVFTTLSLISMQNL